VALLQDGLNPKQVAKELGCSTAKSYRLRKRAVEMGLLAASGR
jgi:transposase